MSAPAGFRSEWTTVRGWRVHALAKPATADPGAGRRSAVLVPGLVTASRSMVRLARALSRVGVVSTVVDLPGFGYSDRPVRALDVAEQATVLAEWVTATKRAPAWLVGNSYGCQVVAAAAARYPDAVDRLALVSPTTPPRLRRKLSWLTGLPLPPHPRRSATPTRWRAAALSAVHDRLGDDPHLRLLNVVEYPLASLPRAAGTIRAAVDHDIAADLAVVRVPTLVLRGEGDRMATPDWTASLAAATRGSLCTLPGVSHDMFWSAADRVAAALASGG